MWCGVAYPMFCQQVRAQAKAKGHLGPEQLPSTYTAVPANTDKLSSRASALEHNVMVMDPDSATSTRYLGLSNDLPSAGHTAGSSLPACIMG